MLRRVRAWKGLEEIRASVLARSSRG
uniref:Chloroplastic group IIA intron splicing facilitator CRS1ic isoform X2 n=1 Tax=Rhizophora mucronata TaxID=61149 RepID=A0A2P2K982_RHIMU